MPIFKYQMIKRTILMFKFLFGVDCFGEQNEYTTRGDTNFMENVSV